MFLGNQLKLFSDLHRLQNGKCSALIKIENYSILSASPELFFSMKNKNVICKPMKGTSPRGRFMEEDAEFENNLKNSIKDKAENVMIVDLIRNDLGRIAKMGSVKTLALFDVEKYETILQMTSTITAETAKSPIDVISALFPCGSITGAPKIRTMQIIKETENHSRGIYTGTIGFISPDNYARFSVAIRTIVIDNRDSKAIYGIGGGITWDSDPGEEYDETINKSKILSEIRPDFYLLETMKYEYGKGIFLLEYHLERMEKSAEYFRYIFDKKAILEKLTYECESFINQDTILRLLLSKNGEIRIESKTLINSEEKIWKIGFSEKPVNSMNPFLYHKTTYRVIYENAKKSKPDFDEVILWNEKGEVTEGSITNIVIEKNGRLITPPRKCGLLAGTFRNYLLDNGNISESIIKIGDIQKTDKVYLINSIRGWINTKIEISN